MIYEWRCTQCDDVVTVQRKVADHKRGPDSLEAEHPGCDSLKFKRILSAPSRIFVHELEDVYWKGP